MEQDAQQSHHSHKYSGFMLLPTAKPLVIQQQKKKKKTTINFLIYAVLFENNVTKRSRALLEIGFSSSIELFFTQSTHDSLSDVISKFIFIHLHRLNQ